MTYLLEVFHQAERAINVKARVHQGPKLQHSLHECHLVKQMPTIGQVAIIMNATQQVGERREARAHAHKTEQRIEFHTVAEKKCSRTLHFSRGLPLESESSISLGIL